LSRPIHALVAARLGRVDEAYELFLRGATVDLLADAHVAPGGTFIGGIHVAACGATWQVAVLGFGGVHVRDDHVEVAPRLPAEWEALCFGFAVRDRWLEVEATTEAVTVRAADDNPGGIDVALHGRRLLLEPGERQTVSLDRAQPVGQR
jgi:1,2-alpha-glucosylglycerol phosphorylase